MLDCPQLFSSAELMPRAYVVSSTMRIGVYGCLYAVLAEREGCELVAADDRLVKTLPQFPIVSLSSLSDGPSPVCLTCEMAAVCRISGRIGAPALPARVP
jgi:hypothetical protein